MAQIAKRRLVKGPYKPICRDCAIYFLVTVTSYEVGYIYLYLIAIIWFVSPLNTFLNKIFKCPLMTNLDFPRGAE